MSMNPHRSLIQALFFEKDGDLNISQLLVIIMGLAGVFGFIWQMLTCNNVFEVIAGWSFLGAAFASVLIASLPVAKAKILANSKLPGEVAKAIADTAMTDPGVSTDVQELKQKQSEEIG